MGLNWRGLAAAAAQEVEEEKGRERGGQRGAEERAEGGAWAEPSAASPTSSASPAGERAAGLTHAPPLSLTAPHHLPFFASLSSPVPRYAEPQAEDGMFGIGCLGFESALVMPSRPGYFWCLWREKHLWRRASKSPGKLLNPSPLQLVN